VIGVHPLAGDNLPKADVESFAAQPLAWFRVQPAVVIVGAARNIGDLRWK
jgi:prephenate dehydrogenase